MVDMAYDLTKTTLQQTLGDIMENDPTLTGTVRDIAKQLDEGMNTIEGAATRINKLQRDETLADSYRKKLIGEQLQRAENAATTLHNNVGAMVDTWQAKTEQAARLPQPAGDPANMAMAVELKRQAISKRLDASEDNQLSAKIAEIIEELHGEDDAIGMYALAGSNYLKGYLDSRGPTGRFWTDEVINATNKAIAPYLPSDIATARQLLAKHTGAGADTLNNVVSNAQWYCSRRLEEIRKAVK